MRLSALAEHSRNTVAEAAIAEGLALVYGKTNVVEGRLVEVRTKERPVDRAAVRSPYYRAPYKACAV